MKCLYCHERIDPTSDACPQCGLPTSRDVTLADTAGTLSSDLPPYLKPAALLLLVAAFSGVAGFGVGWALSRPYAHEDAARLEPASASAQPAAMAAGMSQGAVVSTPAPAPSLVVEPRAPASAQAPVISPAIALTEPLKPVQPPSAVHGPSDPWAYRPGDAALRPRPRLAAAELPDPMPPSHPLAVDPFPAHQQPYVYVSPVLATMGDVTVQISPVHRSVRASLIP